MTDPRKIFTSVRIIRRAVVKIYGGVDYTNYSGKNLRSSSYFNADRILRFNDPVAWD